MSQGFRTLLNEHINQSIKEGDDYLMSNKISISIELGAGTTALFYI